MARIFWTDSVDPYHNLAMEEALLDHSAPAQPILMLWQNQHTVVIGQHQNAWAECNHTLLQEEDGRLARRTTGGGAVYHDMGNLNYSFLMPREQYDVTAQLQIILDALQSLGIQAVFSGRNDLTIQDRKFSGNAYCIRKNSALLHGTLMVDTSFERMSRYLNVSKQKLTSKGIASVKSRVINLVEAVPALTVDTLKDALYRQFAKTYSIDPTPNDPAQVMTPGLLIPYQQKQLSWEWQFGHSPQFEVTLEDRLGFGMVTIHLRLKDGIVEDAIVYSDAMDGNMIMRIAPALRNVRYEAGALRDALISVNTELADYVAGAIIPHEGSS